MRLGLVAAKPTDAVTYGLLPAAARLGLEVFLLTDQPDGHAGTLARARPDLGRPGGSGSAGCGLYGSGTWWHSGWPGRTHGTSHTTGSECIHPLRSIT